MENSTNCLLKFKIKTTEQLSNDPVAVVRKKKRQAPPPPNQFTGEVEVDFKNISLDASFDGDDDLSAQELIDFSPVYRCLHIYTVLVSDVKLLV